MSLTSFCKENRYDFDYEVTRPVTVKNANGSESNFGTFFSFIYNDGHPSLPPLSDICASLEFYPKRIHEFNFYREEDEETFELCFIFEQDTSLSLPFVYMQTDKKIYIVISIKNCTQTIFRRIEELKNQDDQDFLNITYVIPFDFKKKIHYFFPKEDEGNDEDNMIIASDTYTYVFE